MKLYDIKTVAVMLAVSPWTRQGIHPQREIASGAYRKTSAPG